MTSSSRRSFVQTGCYSACISAALCLLAPAHARAQDARAQDARALQEAQAEQEARAQTQSDAPVEAPQTGQSQDALPGSSRPPGLSLSPQAPPTPPAPGGRAPSFGSAADPDAWTFRIGGRISGFGQVGIGRTPRSADSDRGLSLHTPPAVVGRTPIYAGPGATLNLQYGSQTITAFVSFETALSGKEWQSYYPGEKGPRIRTAYVAVTPAPLGNLRLRFQVGAFPANYGAPGPWGWGVYGPVLGIHGYGGLATANYELSPSTRLYAEYGVSGVPEVDKDTVRGTSTDWPEVGLSTIVHHVHAGVSYQNKYFAKLHLARADGRDMRKDGDPSTPEIEPTRDGTLDIAALELRWMADPYGELGVTPVYWNFDDALAVHDGIGWGLDWTAGGREMTSKFLGKSSNGNGKIFAVSAEYDFSVKRMLLHPKPFDGNGPDLRVALAFLPFWTLKSAEPAYEDTSGYFLGATFEHVLLSWFSTTYQLYGESRDGATVDTDASGVKARWAAFSATAGVVLHSSWQSQDRIVLAYSRYFYTKFADNNPELPLDRDVFTLGGSVAF